MTTTSTRVGYVLEEGVATITMDDGKANALSVAMLNEIGAALDRARDDDAAVVLTGRASTFSGGFDLRCPPDGWAAMVAGGARLAERLLAFPRPVVAACNGSAVAMGAFVLLSCDVRIGVTGEHRIGLNEVAIGLTVPWFGIALARHRLPRPWFDRCTVTGALVGPEDAVRAGFLDRLVEPGELAGSAATAVRELLALDAAAHAATKLRVREHVLEGVRAGAQRIESGAAEW